MVWELDPIVGLKGPVFHALGVLLSQDMVGGTKFCEIFNMTMEKSRKNVTYPCQNGIGYNQNLRIIRV